MTKPSAPAAKAGPPKKVSAPASALNTTAKKPAVAKGVAKGAPAQKRTFIQYLFSGSDLSIDVLPNEEKEKAGIKRLHGFLMMETLVGAVLAFGFVFGQPLFQPDYQYYAILSEKSVLVDRKVVSLVPLTMPNMTNHALLSWAASSITEVMTIGFGDFEPKMIAQKWRFTRDGWGAFVKAFMSSKSGERFRQNQLVLTTVPSDTPVIVSQGENPDQIYQWIVQMPIVMTYATNNNITKKEKGVVTLTILRSNESPSGIAIDSWAL